MARRGSGAGVSRWLRSSILAKINVVNRAIGGRSSRTYITEGQWADTLALMKAGDVVLCSVRA